MLRNKVFSTALQVDMEYGIHGQAMLEILFYLFFLLFLLLNPEPAPLQ